LNKMVPISTRMKTIADMVPMGLSVADIGCDHGFVSIYLVMQRKAPFVLAMDVNEGPLLRAKEHIEQYEMEDFINTRLSDGAVKLNRGEVEAAVIAGMGGKLTIKILEESFDKFKAMKSIVLSPHSDIPAVRNYLTDKGYCIQDEEMVFDEGKYYTIIRCQWDGISKALTVAELEYGPMLIEKKSQVLKEYLVSETEKLTEIKDRLKGDGNHSERVNEISEMLKRISEVLVNM